jgi:hypothetical protein
MTEFALALVVFALAVLGLATGVLTGRGAPRGTCGGLNRIPGVSRVCGCSETERERCRRRSGGAKETS